MMPFSHPHMPEHVLYVGGFPMDSSAPQSPTDQTIFIGLKIFYHRTSFLKFKLTETLLKVLI